MPIARKALDGEAGLLGFERRTRGLWLLLSPRFAESNDHQAAEGDQDERSGVDAVQLADIPVEKRQTEEDKDDVGAEDLKLGLSQGDQRLEQGEVGEQPARPVDDAAERDEIEHAQRADLPLVE